MRQNFVIRPRARLVYVRDRIDVDQAFVNEVKAELDDRNMKVGTPLCFLAREIIHAPNFTFALHGYPLIFAADLYDGRGGEVTTTGLAGEVGDKGDPGTPGTAEWDAT